MDKWIYIDALSKKILKKTSRYLKRFSETLIENCKLKLKPIGISHTCEMVMMKKEKENKC